jgi:HAD superfamily hydrolase (TIGR01549 family)
MKGEGGHPPYGGMLPRAVVFDVDGTLYWQRGLRWRMLWDLLFSALVSSRTREDLRILRRFREIRETLGERVREGFAEAQYRLPAEALGVTPERVAEAVRRWIHERPPRYLRRYRVEGIEKWMEELRARGVRLGVYSEYPAEAKIRALGLSVDAAVASTDPEVDAFKPDAKGLQVVMKRLGVPVERTLFVGDREDRDRPCAEAAGVAFLRVGRDGGDSVSSFPPPRHLLPEFLRTDAEE